MKEGALRNFTKFTGKRLRPATLLKKRLWYGCFPVNFAKFLRTPFLQNTSEQLLLYIYELTLYIILYVYTVIMYMKCLLSDVFLINVNTPLKVLLNYKGNKNNQHR